MNNFLPFLIIPMFIGITFVLSRFGWSTLAKEFRASNEFEGKRSGFISARINVVNYNNCLILSHNENGMYLKPFLLFRLFHPPIYIPWSAIRNTSERKVLFQTIVKLEVGYRYSTSIELKRSTFEKLNFRML